MSASRRLGPREAVGDLLLQGDRVTFVQMARSLRLDHGALRLEDLAPSTVWVLRGSEVTVGQLSTGSFLDLWWAAHDDAADWAPVARLSLLDADARLLGDPRLRLRAPRITGSGITYDVDILAGLVPDSTGACVLFINPPEGDAALDDAAVLI